MILCRKEDPLSDFRNFLTAAYRAIGIKKPTKRQLYIAHFMQFGPRRKVVEAFRGIGKSWEAATFAMFCLYHRPEMNIMVVSASKQRADNFTTFCMRLMQEVPFLRHMQPRPDQRSSKIQFDVANAPVSQSPSLYSAGITGQITGSRADLIIADDVEVPNNSSTQMMREKLSESIKEFDAILKPNGNVLYLGTPQTEESIYNDLTDRGYEVRIWPARFPDAKQLANYGSRLAPDIRKEVTENPRLVGKTTEPERFSDVDLAERELSYGRAGFSLQFMLDTDLSDMDRYPLKITDLLFTSLNAEVAPERVVWAANPEYVVEQLDRFNVGFRSDRFYRPVPLPDLRYLPYTGCVMAIDPAGRGKDETAYAVVAFLHGILYLLDAGGFSGYGDDTLEALAKKAQKWQVKKIVVEANFGDGMFTRLLQPVLGRVYPCTTEEVKHSQQKEKRIIDTLEPVMASHKLVINQDLVQRDYESVLTRPTETQHLYRLFYQLAHITREKGALAHDDRLDALSIAVAYWVEHMSRDTQKAVADARAEAFEQELERFKAHVFGWKDDRSESFMDQR